VTVGIVDGPVRVTDGQALASGLTVSPIVGATVLGEVGGLVDECSGLGIGTGVWGVPEGTAQVDLSICVGIWSVDLLAGGQQNHDRKIYAQT